MTPELSVVVPILGYDSIATFMQTLQVAWSDSIEVIILDSTPFGKRQDTVNYDESGKSTIIRAIIDPPINFYQTLNMGLKMARGEHIVLSHDDVLFGYKSLKHCVDAINKFELPCVYPRSTFGPALLERFAIEGKTTSENPLELGDEMLEYYSFCLVIESDIFDFFGYFDDQFEMYCGDRDYRYRLIQEGYPPRMVNNALVHHFEGRTIRTLQSSGKDFSAIEKSDKSKFKSKWGHVNAKQLIREMRKRNADH